MIYKVKPFLLHQAMLDTQHIQSPSPAIVPSNEVDLCSMATGLDVVSFFPLYLRGDRGCIPRLDKLCLCFGDQRWKTAGSWSTITPLGKATQLERPRRLVRSICYGSPESCFANTS